MLLILCGYTAAGKDTYQEELIKRYGFRRAVSYTTRPMRQGEVDGVHYYFTDNEGIEKAIAREGVLTDRRYETFCRGKKEQWRYVLTEEAIKGDNVISIIDHQGIKNIISKIGKDNVFVAYLHTDDDTLYKRSAARGDEKIEFIRRLQDDKIKFQGISKIADLILDSSDKNLEANLAAIVNNIKKKEEISK